MHVQTLARFTVNGQRPVLAVRTLLIVAAREGGGAGNARAPPLCSGQARGADEISDRPLMALPDGES